MTTMKTHSAALRRLLAGILLVLMFSPMGCRPLAPKRPEPEKPPLIRLSRSHLPDFSDDMGFAGLANAISQSLDYFDKIPRDRTLSFGTDAYTAGEVAASLAQFADFIAGNPSRQALNTYIRKNFTVYQAAGRNERRDVLFTGYYEPGLMGSPVETEKFAYPIYGLPRDLVTIDLSLFSSKYAGEKIVGRRLGDTVVPYYTREEITTTPVLAETADPIAWVADPIALFFLHVQGSGKVFLDNGRTINVHYRGTNGRPYKSIGKYLIETGKIKKEDMSLQAITAYLKKNPDEMAEVFNVNPSYIFFETVDAGPIGCYMAQLVPGRSIALDKSAFPAAALAFVITQKPVIDADGTITGWTPFSRFVLNHDTGGAIKGPGRADIFWGSGKAAAITAGHLKHTGKMYFLIKKSAP